MLRISIFLTFHLYFLLKNRIRSFFLSVLFSCPYNCRFGRIGLVYGYRNIRIGKKCIFNDYFYLTTWPNRSKYTPDLKIGENCCFGAYNHISCINKITIGNNVLTGKWVTIVDNNHGDIDIESLKIPPMERPLSSNGPVNIGDNVWIGDKVTILAGVTIGNGTIIAANSVVTKDIPPYVVAGGIPAKIL